MNLRPLLLLTPLILLHRTASASTAEAEKRLQIAVNEVLSTADVASSGNALTGSLRPVLQKYVSFEAMTRRAVGPGWRLIYGRSAKEGHSALHNVGHPHLQQQVDSRRAPRHQIQIRVRSLAWPCRGAYHPVLSGQSV